MSALPKGTVTFLFTDIEGSTQLLNRFGDGYRDILAKHRAILSSVFARNNGFQVNTEGDSFFIAFPRAADAVAAAVSGQKELAEHQWPEHGEVWVRMGLHTGEPVHTEQGYTGLDVHRAARISSAAHGGQVLISAGSKILVGGRFPPGVSLRDLGEHRLKDLEQPEHLFQLIIPGLRTDFPPIRTLNNCPNNLPVQITPLFGREQELGQVCDLLRRADLRLLTLMGPGGVGKTLLALQAGTALLANFGDGTFVVNLSAATDPLLLPTEIANALGVKESGGGQSLIGRLVSHLREGRLLLILDNLEQLAGVSKTISTLLEGCPSLKILATSRAPLRVRGEYTFNVAPLSVPSLPVSSNLTELLASPTVGLFVERAKATKGDFALNEQNASAVAEICRYLDGLPLAIELVAARIKLLSPQAMLTRLIGPDGNLSLQLLSGGAHDLPERHQTLRGAVAWSYNLLEADVKKLFCRLSIFAGGCTLSTAEIVCPQLGDLKVGVMDGIATLVDNSLLRQEEGSAGEPRISMLHTIREFGLEQLRKSRVEAEAHKAHAMYFAAFAEEAELNRNGPDDLLWAQRVEVEQANLRAALSWSFKNAPEIALKIAAAVGNFWFSRGHWTELRDICLKIEQEVTNGDIAARARVLRYAGQVASISGDSSRAEKYFEQSLALSEQSESKSETVDVLNELGGTLVHHGARHAEARSLFNRALDLSRALDDERRIADTLIHLADLAAASGEYEQARQQFEEASALCRKRGYRAGLGRCMSYLGELAIVAGEFEQASSCLRIALQIHEAAGDNHSLVWDRYKRAQVACYRGEYTQARVEFEDCLTAFQQMAVTSGEAWCLYELGKVALETEEFLDASNYFERSLAMFRALAGSSAWVTLHLGIAATYEGRFRSARKCLEKSATAFRGSETKNGLAQALCALTRLSRLLGEHDRARSLLDESLNLAKQIESKWIAAIVLEQCAYLLKGTQEDEACARLLGKVAALHEEMGTQVPPRNRAEYEKTIETVRAALDEAAFSTLTREGRVVHLEQLDRLIPWEISKPAPPSETPA